MWGAVNDVLYTQSCIPDVDKNQACQLVSNILGGVGVCSKSYYSNYPSYQNYQCCYDDYNSQGVFTDLTLKRTSTSLINLRNT